MATASRNGPLAPHMRPCALRRRIVWMDDNPPSKGIYFFELLRACIALKILRCCGDTSSLEQRGALRAIHTHNNPKNYAHLLGGLSAIYLMCRHGAQGLMWGTRGPFPPASAMVVVVVMPVVFVLRLLKSAIKTLKLVVCKQTYLFFTMYCKTYYNSCNAICSMAGAQTFVGPMEPQHIGYCQKADNVTKTVASSYLGRNVGMKEIEKNDCWPCT
jgi:hypothetical protein